MDEQCAEQSHVRLAMVSGLLFILRKPETCNAVDPKTSLALSGAQLHPTLQADEGFVFVEILCG